MVTETIRRIDGRAARGERSRAAVATALLDLLEEGIVEPTAGQIAARAKVSERLVFHHFADLEVLRRRRLRWADATDSRSIDAVCAD